MKVPYPIWARSLAAILVIGTLLPIPFFMIKEWPSNWKELFKKKFCSGYANYMPDPSRYVNKTNHNSMIYEPQYPNDDERKRVLP